MSETETKNFTVTMTTGPMIKHFQVICVPIRGLVMVPVHETELTTWSYAWEST